MPPKRKIEIKCTGAATAKLEDLVPLQGKLKALDAARYRKLKRALLEHGFSFPFFVWKRPKKEDGKGGASRHDLCILDGHQRDRVLRRLKAQGYEVPPLPIAFVEAKDETEARKKILLLSSQYGQMSEDSLMEYLKESDLEFDEILDTADLPQIDLDKLAKKLEEEFLEEESGAGELQHQFQVVVDCKDEAQQLALIEMLEKRRFTCRALIL